MYLCALWVRKATRICACRTKPRAESGRCEIMPTRAKTQTLSRAMSRSSVTSSQHLCHKRHTVRVLAIIGVLSKLTKIPSQEMLHIRRLPKVSSQKENTPILNKIMAFTPFAAHQQLNNSSRTTRDTHTRVRVEVQREKTKPVAVCVCLDLDHALHTLAPSSSSAATGAAEQRPLAVAAGGAAAADATPFSRQALVASTDALAPWARALAAAAEGAALMSTDDILRKTTTR